MGPERHPSALGARGRDCWDEIWDIIGPQIEYVMAGHGATWHEDQLVPVTRHGRREDVWWTYSFGPIDVEGKVGGVLVVCKDVTSEHRAREALNLINEELKHRVKNTLTVLGAVAAQTFRGASSKADDLEKYQGRLAAFGRAHDLLTAANWAAAPLHDVIGTALTPYRTGDGRFEVSGPPLVVKSRQALALSLAIHELATNALKYGALTVASGHVSIAWTSEDQEGEPKFVFAWQEFGGPPASQPTGVGFWFAPHFPGAAGRFRRLRRSVVSIDRTYLPPDGSPGKSRGFSRIASPDADIFKCGGTSVCAACFRSGDGSLREERDSHHRDEGGVTPASVAIVIL